MKFKIHFPKYLVVRLKDDRVYEEIRFSFDLRFSFPLLRIFKENEQTTQTR